MKVKCVGSQYRQASAGALSRLYDDQEQGGQHPCRQTETATALRAYAVSVCLQGGPTGNERSLLRTAFFPACYFRVKTAKRKKRNLDREASTCALVLALRLPNDLQSAPLGLWRSLGNHSARTRHLNAIPRAVIGLINCISTPTCPLSWRYSSDFVDAAPGRPAAQPLGVPAAFDEIG